MKSKLLVLILILCSLFLTGCAKNSGVEGKAYVIAIGIDKGENNNLKLSLQTAVLNSTSDSSSGSQEEKSTNISVECSTIDAGISLINSYISKQIDLSHCKAVIISEELASVGVSEYILTLVNNVQIRPSCNIIISKCSASDFLENFKPVFESVQSKYYESILNATEYTGYIADLHLSDFYSSILSNSSEASAILGGISGGESNESNLPDSEYKAEETTIKGKNNIENMGLAVFRRDKLVGELNNIETLCHLIVTNQLENATITIPNPLDNNSNISIYIDLTKNTKNTVDFVNGFPYINCKVYVSGNILSLTQSLDLTDVNTINILNSSINRYLEEKISDYLYKTSKELNSDIAGFGKYVLPKYRTWEEWLNSDWLNNYGNAFFNVAVESHVQSGYLFNDI